MLTTDYVVDETLTLLKARGQPQIAIQLGEQFFEGQIVMIHRLSEDEILAAWEMFKQYADKEWSFTDCASKVVIETLGIAEALSFDEHFRQFGSVAVVPLGKLLAVLPACGSRGSAKSCRC